MNILQAHKFYWYRDGASNYALYLSSLLKKRGHHVVPFSALQEESLPTEYSKFFVEYIDLGAPAQLNFFKKIKALENFFYSKEAARNMERLLEHEAVGGRSVNVLHIHNIYHHISPSILKVAKKHGVKIVMTLHDYKLLAPNYSLYHHGRVHEEDARGWYATCVSGRCVKNSFAQSAVSTAAMIYHHKIKKYYEHYVDKFIAPSQFMMDLCTRHGWPREKFVHIPLPIDSNRFRPDTARISATGANIGTDVLYVGRLSEEKGLDVLLSAAKLTPGIKYRIIGTGPMEQNLKRRSQSEAITNVIFSGFQQTEQVTQSLQSARLVVLPSQWYENYPISVLEAKAMEKIILGSRIGGLPELLDPDMLYSPPGSAQALANLILKWYNAATTELQKRGRFLRAQVLEKNSPDSHVKKIEEIYAGICKK